MTKTLEQVAQEIAQEIKNYHKGMSTLKVEVQYGIITFVIKSKRAAEKIQMDMLRTRAFRSVVLQYQDSRKMYAVQAAPK